MKNLAKIMSFILSLSKEAALTWSVLIQNIITLWVTKQEAS
jgi:hypothetical protein